MSSLPVIGWIGAGRMGVAMAGFTLKAGYPLLVYSPTAASRQKLVALGAREALSVAQCATAADIVFSCITNDAALREVALGPQGVLDNAKPGVIFIDTSTVSAQISAQVAEQAQTRGIAYLRIPISGNAASTRTGNATALITGSQTAWNTVKPIVQTFSVAQVYLGSGDEARIMKLVVNLLVYAHAQAMAEALTLGRKAGLDWNLMLDAARSNDVPLPITALTRQLTQALIGEGYGDEDYMAAIKLAEKQAGLQLGDGDAKT